jgi:flavodoxin/formate hydrogenlyase subunit 6/NADH:ubiquinone oxidoreductase subunit I
MKCAIVYFSQTQNTEKIAKCIQKGVIAVAGNCDLLPLRDTSPKKMYKYDLIGIGSPVFRPEPRNVGEWVNDLWGVGGKHAFAFCTHGTGHKRFYPGLYPVLAERGLTVIGSGDWYGDCYLLHMTQPYPTAGHPDAIDLEDAEAFGRDMAVRSMRIRSGETDLIPAAPEPLAPMGAPPVETGKAPSPNVIGTFTELLKFDKEKCLYPNCTLCMDNCPTYGMDLSLDPPVLAQPCIDCEFCARLCPTGALDMTPWLEAMEDMTVRNSYRMLDALEQAEKGGRFRRLIPLSEIDTTRTGYKQYTVHPQWIIGKGPQKSEG